MRTVIDIDDDLLEEARARARQDGKSLDELLDEALRQRLAREGWTRGDLYPGSEEIMTQIHEAFRRYKERRRTA